MAIDMSRFIVRFVEEARDHIEKLESGVAMLESDPNEQENINTIFRSAHTIKGSSRMLKLLTISDTAHKLEDVLGALRDSTIHFTPELARILYRAIDALAILIDIAEKKDLLPELDQSLCNILEQAASGDFSAADTSTATDENNVTLKDEDKKKAAITESIKETKQESLKNSNKTSLGKDNTTDEALVISSQSDKNVAQSDSNIVLKTSDTVRIQLSKLDEVIKLMGEVVSSHSLMHQRVVDFKQLEFEINSNQHQQSGFASHLKKFEKNLHNDVLSQQLLMEELHDKAMIMRMLPLSIVFDPAARLIRELARSVDKEVECVIKGGEIELDRQMIDKLSDPIVHLLRNAVDHGIETPQARKAAGKASLGQVQLTARQDSGWVVIDIKDNGAGLPIENIRKKALSKGLFTETEIEALTEKEVMDLIFLPGFSTNAIITDLSGRGVGLDVVKKTIIEDLHGVIDIASNDTGTTFSLKLPLSLAIMRVLLCEVSNISFGFTAQYISSLVQVKKQQIKVIAERQVINIGSELIQVVSLAKLLGLQTSASSEKTLAQEKNELLLVIIKTQNDKLALIIDSLVDEQDMVIKPLPIHMKNLPLVTGMVMTGKRELVSILNVPKLVKNVRQLAKNKSLSAQSKSVDKTKPYHVLVVDDSLNTREIEKDVLEASGYSVTTAEDGVDGLAKARSEDFDAILTDVEMPKMDGFTLTQQLRQDERFKHTPIIIVTSREKQEDKLRGIEVGADAYIVKGDFEQSNLVETLQNLLA